MYKIKKKKINQRSRNQINCFRYNTSIWFKEDSSIGSGRARCKKVAILSNIKSKAIKMISCNKNAIFLDSPMVRGDSSYL